MIKEENIGQIFSRLDNLNLKLSQKTHRNLSNSENELIEKEKDMN